MRRLGLPLVLLAILITAAVPQGAFADGDPGSDVLVYEPLFLAADSGISVQQQAGLGNLLGSARRSGFQIRVAIIAGPSDLGAITGLWRKPRLYARFLGLELSLAYRGRLLVVMPNGFGFNWPGQETAPAYRVLDGISVGSGAAGLAGSAQSAVKSLAAAAGVRLRSVEPTAGRPQQTGQATPTGAAQHAPGSSLDAVVAAAVALAAIAAMGLIARATLRRSSRRLRAPRPTYAVTLAIATAAAGALVVLVGFGASGGSTSEALGHNPNLDPGTPLRGGAPGFTLTDQFGQPVSLASYHGKVVLLAFNDSECTTICPLTTTAMLDARAMLGAAGSRVQLLGIDANPKATSLQDVLSYSELHGLMHEWHFLTGSLSQLARVWKAYGVQAAVEGGQIAHTPALFVIDPAGRLARLYVTQQSYAAVGQLGQLLAQEASSLLPDHPPVDSNLTYAQITGVSPAAAYRLPQAAGGTLHLGPGHPRLYLFFATWDQEITSLAGELDALDSYADSATSQRLPALTAIDETSVEPSRSALEDFLAALPHPLAYPVALDTTGRVADGYEVQGQPWFVLTSGDGRIVWYWQVATSGWPSRSALIAHVRAALARAPSRPAGRIAAAEALAGSPPALAALHRQASQLLGPTTALLARVRGLRGYPIVINAWASWCTACRAEFGLLAAASARYGRRIAFVGVDTSDSAGDARSFLGQHPISYPSYQSDETGLDRLVPQGLVGLPTTVFLGPTGKLVYVHTGQYASQGSLDADIHSYALSG